MGLGTTYGPRRDSRLARTSSQLQVLSFVIVFWKAAKKKLEYGKCQLSFAQKKA